MSQVEADCQRSWQARRSEELDSSDFTKARLCACFPWSDSYNERGCETTKAMHGVLQPVPGWMTR